MTEANERADMEQSISQADFIAAYKQARQHRKMFLLTEAITFTEATKLADIADAELVASAIYPPYEVALIARDNGKVILGITTSEAPRCLHEMVPDWCATCLGIDDSHIPYANDTDADTWEQR